MNLLYITNLNIKYNVPFGVLKKIIGQVNAFKKLQYNVDLCFYVDNDFLIYKVNYDKFEYFKGSQSNSLLNTLKGRSALCQLAKKVKLLNYEIVYIRFVSLNINTVNFIKLIKKAAKFIVLEIPTFPYMKENFFLLHKSNFIGFIRLFKYCLIDLLLRIPLRNYISFIVLTIPKKSLWGIPVVSIENGIDFQRVSSRCRSALAKDIVLCTATNIEHWQGLDRIILGLYDYKQKYPKDCKIKIKITGEGSEKNKLKDMVKKLNLEENIHFFGQMSGKDLDNLYNNSDIAIGSLGRHRQKINIVSTLKVKEFCAKGIPFIYSNDEPALSGHEGFALKVPANDSPIDFFKVLEFYDSVQSSPAHVIDMKNFARDRFDWIHQIDIIHKKILLQIR